MDDKFEMILAQLTELQKGTKENGERLARVETQMYTLVGNGQPGRIALLERAVEELKRWRWWLVGAGAGCGGAGAVLAWVIEVVVKR